MPTLPEAALAYAKIGWHVFPLKPRDKRPLGWLAPNGVKNATTHLGEVGAWWREEPRANIGLACGPKSGVLVIDFDGPLGLVEYGRREPDMKTLCSRTANGYHAFYQWPHKMDPAPKNAVKIVPGVDLRSAGGYVILPPSVHPSGWIYQWVDDVEPCPEELALTPQWLQTILRETAKAERIAAPQSRNGGVPNNYAAAALEGELVAVRSAKEGTRNHTLNVAAVKLGGLVGAGLLTRDFVYGALVGAASACGLPTQEAERTVESGLRAGEANPRVVPPWPFGPPPHTDDDAPPPRGPHA